MFASLRRSSKANSDGSFTVRPIRSEADLVVLHLGFSATLR